MRPLPLTGVTGLLSLVVPNVAEAAPQVGLADIPRPAVAIGQIRGESGRVFRQLAAAVCSVYRCVPRYRVTTEGQASLDKMDEWGVDGYLSGAVTREGGRSGLGLDLVTTSPRPSRTWLLPITKEGRLAPGSVQQLMRDLEAELAAPAPAAPPPASLRPAPDSTEQLVRDLEIELGSAEQLMRDLEGEIEQIKRDLEARLAAPAPAAPPPAVPPLLPPVAATPVPVARVEAPATAAAAPRARSSRGRTAQWLVAAEAGTFLASRSLAYAGTSPGPTPLLRGYQGPLAGPYVSAEFFPIAPFSDGALMSGIGLFARYAFSLGLKTTASSQEYPSTFSALDAGLEWRLRPFASTEFALIPAVSYQMQKFAVAPPFPGLPDSNLSGVAGSLRTEVPLGDVVTLLLGGSYTQWLRAKDLIGDGFFPAGSAYALEAEAGVGVAIGSLSVRVLGFYETTRYSLQVGSRPLYRATSASDTQVSGRATLRASF